MKMHDKIINDILAEYPGIKRYELVDALSCSSEEKPILLYMDGQTPSGYKTFHIKIDRNIEDDQFTEAKNMLLLSGAFSAAHGDEKIAHSALHVLWHGLTENIYSGDPIDDPLVDRCSSIIGRVHSDGAVIIATAYTDETKQYVKYTKYPVVKYKH